MDNFELYDSGDKFFEEVWDLIDNSKTNCWILTYHMAESFIADETLRRLIKAAERGVSVVLVVDWLNDYKDKTLSEKLIRSGGQILRTNSMKQIPLFSMKVQFMANNPFERFHQKIMLIDDTVLLGSSNFDIDYGGNIYGNNTFYDFNLKIRRKNIMEVKEVFFRIAERFGYKLKDFNSDEEVDENLEYLSSEPYYAKWDIQEKMLEMIERATSRIIIINGYYYKIKQFTSAIERAKARGVHVDLFTSKRRDQPVYKSFTNYGLTKGFLLQGVNVYESSESILHAKALIADDELTLGSFNSDRWSWSINNEFNIYYKNKAACEKVINTLKESSIKFNPVVKAESSHIIKFIKGFWHRFLLVSEKFMSARKDMKYFIPHAYIHDSNITIEERHIKGLKLLEVNTNHTFKFNLFIHS